MSTTHAQQVEQFRLFKEAMKEQALRADFESTIEGLEAQCHKYAPARVEGPPPPLKSDAWFAREILFSIHEARSLLARGHASAGAGEAVQLGGLAGAWPHAQRWREQQEQRREQARVAGKIGGSRITANADELQDLVAYEARGLQQKHLYDRGSRSTRWLARAIGAKLKRSEATVRDVLGRLKIK